MTYQAKKNWGPDDPVMETDYNRIETGIEDAHQLTKDLANELGGSFVVSGLTFNYSGLTATWAAGVAYVKGQRFSVPAGSIALNANQGQYIYLDTDGAIKKSTSQAVADGVCPLWYFTTNATTVLSYTDRRNILNETLTVDQAQAPSSNTAKWPKFLSFFANRFKAITGESDWKTDPVKTIKQLWADLSGHIADTVSHITAAERSAWNAKLSNTINQDIQMTGDFEITGMITERSTYANVHHNLASLKGLASLETGCIVIETTIPFGTSVMGMVEIDIYEYNTTTTVSKLVVGFYSGNAGAVQVGQQGHVLIGNRRLRVRLANKSGKVAIIIGETTDSFSYPQVVVSKATLTYSNLSNMTYREGWLITNKVTDLTAYVNQVESTDRTGLALKTDFDAHIGSGGASHAVATTTAAGFMSVADYTKLQGIQAGAEVNQNTFATIAVKNNAGTSKGSVAADSKQDTATLREGTAILMTADSATDEITISVDTTQFAPAAHVGAGGAAHAVATPTAAGFMSVPDKTKLDSVESGAKARFFKELLGYNKALGDVVISSNTTDANSVLRYNNLTINAGVTLTLSAGVTILYVAGTLTLNGVISVDGKGASGGAGGRVASGGAGGAGGGILLVIAEKIVGSGKITANGSDGANATGAYTGTAYTAGFDGTAGSLFGSTLVSGKGGVNNPPVSNDTMDYSSISKAIEWFSADALDLSVSDVGSAGGGGGNSGGLQKCTGGNGGSGARGAGGTGGYMYYSSTSGLTTPQSSSGGGGGGGGLVVVYSQNAIPAITLEAKGGKGGDSYGTSGGTTYYGAGGAGGGGGQVIIAAPSSSATVNVSGGTPGSNVVPSVAPTTNTPPTVGSAGASKFIQIT